MADNGMLKNNFNIKGMAAWVIVVCRCHTEHLRALRPWPNGHDLARRFVIRPACASGYRPGA